MNITVVEDSPTRLTEYARVPIGFMVSTVFDDDAIAALLHGAPTSATSLARPYWKDYDSYAGNHPADWPSNFDVSRWTILAAYHGTQRVGGAIVIRDDPEIELLRDCPNCALLWDLRVVPERRGQRIGSTLLRTTEDAAVRCGGRALRVETQQTNVPACRFYERNGFRLERARSGAYRALPAETQLVWHKSLELPSVAPSA